MLAAVILTWCLAQTPIGVRADTPATARARYAAINRELKRARRIERDMMGVSSEGGALTAYYQGKAPRKLVARIYGETGRTTTEYYFWRGQLFFVYEADLSYDAPLSGKIIRRHETRAYFEAGKLVRLLSGKTPQSLATSQAKQQAQQFIADTRFYLDVATKPDTQDERKYP